MEGNSREDDRRGRCKSAVLGAYGKPKNRGKLGRRVYPNSLLRDNKDLFLGDWLVTSVVKEEGEKFAGDRQRAWLLYTSEVQKGFLIKIITEELYSFIRSPT